MRISVRVAEYIVAIDLTQLRSPADVFQRSEFVYRCSVGPVAILLCYQPFLCLAPRSAIVQVVRILGPHPRDLGSSPGGVRSIVIVATLFQHYVYVCGGHMVYW